MPARQDIEGWLKGRNVLYEAHSLGETAQKFGKNEGDTERLLDQARQKLFASRAQLPRPPADTKIITAWNGLMVPTPIPKSRTSASTKEARGKGFAVETHTIQLSDVDRAITDGDTDGFARVHVNKKNGKILGATLVGKHAGESIGEVVLAMMQGLKLSSLSGIIHPYPTQAEVLKHLGNEGVRSRFKPWMRKLLQRYFAWRRS